MVSNDRRSLIISLIDPINMLKAGFTQYVEGLLIDSYASKEYGNIPVQHLHNYNHTPFFVKLIEEIFSSNAKIGSLPASTSVLMDDGMDVTNATELALRVFNLTIAVISSYVPETNFLNDGYRFSIVDEYDLFVAPPYEEQRDDETTV